MLVGDKVTLKDTQFENEKGEALPSGSTIRFQAGFAIRQEVDGMRGYGYPTKSFWEVEYYVFGGGSGIFIPEGTEEHEMGEGEGRVARTLTHEAAFFLIHEIRFPSVAEVVKLPE